MPVGSPRSSFVAKLPERADDRRLDQLDLAAAGSRWQCSISVGCGSRLPGGRHLRTLAMKTSLAREPDLPSSCVEQLARLADERQALLVLVRARRLADEHQVGVGVARAEDDLRAGLPRAAGSASQPRASLVDAASSSSRRSSAVPGWTGRSARRDG